MLFSIIARDNTPTGLGKFKMISVCFVLLGSLQNNVFKTEIILYDFISYIYICEHRSLCLTISFLVIFTYNNLEDTSTDN